MAMHAIYDISAIFGAPSSLTLVFSFSRIITLMNIMWKLVKPHDVYDVYTMEARLTA